MHPSVRSPRNRGDGVDYSPVSNQDDATYGAVELVTAGGDSGGAGGGEGGGGCGGSGGEGVRSTVTGTAASSAMQ